MLRLPVKYLPYHRHVLRALAHPVSLVSLVIIAALVGVGIWFWIGARSSTEVTTQSALAQYGRAGSETASGPHAGVWTYTSTGYETVGLGPVRVTRDFPSTARIVVRPIRDGYWRALALSEEHVEATRFAVAAAGTRAVARRTTVTVAGFGRTDDVAMLPPALTYPRRLAVGMRWQQHYRLRDIVVTSKVRILRRAVVSVAGHDVPVFVISTTAAITGPLPGHRTDIDWFAPSLGVPARLRINMHISGTASLDMHLDMRLASLSVAR